MKPTGLMIAVAVLLVLGGVTYWSNKKQASAAKPTDSGTKILTIAGRPVRADPHQEAHR